MNVLLFDQKNCLGGKINAQWKTSNKIYLAIKGPDKIFELYYDKAHELKR